MGTRIKKALIWALPDVCVEDCIIVDSRFSDLFKINEELGGTDCFYDKNIFEEFLNWLRNDSDKAKKVLASKSHLPLASISLDWILKKWADNREVVDSKASDFNFGPVYNPECGIPEVFGFVAGLRERYARCDDIIDNYTESYFAPKNEMPSNWIDWKPCGIYPWIGMVHMPIGKNPPFADKDSKKNWSWLDPADYQMMIGEFGKNRPTVDSEIEEYLRKNYRPTIPDEIILWTYWLGDRLWDDWDSTVNQLRPAMYTYWS